MLGGGGRAGRGERVERGKRKQNLKSFVVVYFAEVSFNTLECRTECSLSEYPKQILLVCQSVTSKNTMQKEALAALYVPIHSTPHAPHTLMHACTHTHARTHTHTHTHQYTTQLGSRMQHKQLSSQKGLKVILCHLCFAEQFHVWLSICRGISNE